MSNPSWKEQFTLTITDTDVCGRDAKFVLPAEASADLFLNAAKAVAPVLADGRPGRLGPGGGQGHGDGGRRCQHHAQDDDSAPHGRAYLTGKSKYVSG